MSAGVGGNEFQTTLDDVRALLDRVRTRPATEGEPVESSAADGKVRVSLQDDGDLTSITVDPKLLRDGLDAVCELIVEAVNAGHRQLRERALGGAEGAPDAAVLDAQLRDLQEQSVRQMAAFGSVLNDVAAQLRRGGER